MPFIREQIEANAGGSTVGTYTIESGKKTSISLPDKLEQQKIGNCLKHLDHLITLHQHKLNILKDIKKYMIFGMLNIEGGKNMPELESIIEKNLID